ncbi:Protein transport protein BET1 [Golovinomyces cichoracearum]|uniref:Protein transport protein BET1 n=1 Tax=Golovinomyces cichoracearum TaxID=62708 RepID=A0A420I8N6_9PEZI|nr:Protein transport protein BET1 [Golovinomyces cichoracearum]
MTRFATSSLHQPPDPRKALFENYQPAPRIPLESKSRRSPIATSGRYEIGNESVQNGRQNFGYRGSSMNNWSEKEINGSTIGFRAAKPNERGQYSDAILSSLESQNDSEVESMIGKVRQLKSMTIAIGDEIRQSSALAEMMNERFEGTRMRIKGTMSRMLVMAQTTGVGWKAWLAFFTAVILLFWWVRLF